MTLPEFCKAPPKTSSTLKRKYLYMLTTQTSLSVSTPLFKRASKAIKTVY